ncbi:MAG TPA: hypothetical protein VMU24_07245 [Candidatus Acidoferrales bacterium]|nr:hypothetical protein [Candidatus Acidoferrales bacterium]
MRTRLMFYVLVLAGLALTQVSFNKINVANGPHFQVAGSAPGGVMTPPACKDPTCGFGQSSNVVVSSR